MKKLLIAAAMLFASTGIFAQAQPKPKESHLKAVDTAKVVKMKSANAPTKKDGTADMRYKQNKEAAKATTPAGPTKKDGTADMRYKTNKEAAKKKS